MTKLQLLQKIYTNEELAHVDVSIPLHITQALNSIGVNPAFYVMDYNENKAFGQLTNLAEKLMKKQESKPKQLQEWAIAS